MKKCVLIFFTAFLSIASFAQIQESQTKADTLISKAIEQLNVPYKWGTSEPSVSFDCSGFASYVYSTVGIDTPRSSRGYASLGKEIRLEDARKGDCMVFSGTESGSTEPGHVGIVVSNDENGLQFIHCSSSKKHFGVVLTHYQTSGYPDRFLSVRRLF